MTSQYTNPVHENQIHLFQMNRLSTFSEKSLFSISSSPSIARSIPLQQPKTPLDHQSSILSDNILSILSEFSLQFSISSSPSILLYQ